MQKNINYINQSLKITECKNIDELNEDEMKLYMNLIFVKFQDLEKPKYPNGFITHYIIDDMIGTNIFKMVDHYLLIYVFVINILHHQILSSLLSL